MCNFNLFVMKYIKWALLHKPICKGFFSDIIFKWRSLHRKSTALLQITTNGKLNPLLAKGAAYESLPWSAFSGWNHSLGCICLGKWWLFRAWFKHDLSNTRAVLMICLSITCGFSPTCLGCIFSFIRFDLKSKYV